MHVLVIPQLDTHTPTDYECSACHRHYPLQSLALECIASHYTLYCPTCGKPLTFGGDLVRVCGNLQCPEFFKTRAQTQQGVG